MSAAFVNRLKSSRIVRGISANVYSQVVQTALQLLSVPIYATHWGLATYGAWLVIFTVPNYLAFADFGFAAAAANDMTVSVARGDRAAAIETFHAVRAAMAGICSILLLVCVAAVYCIPDRSLAFVSGLSHVQARHAILMLAAYGVLSIQNSVSLAAFRSIGRYATGTYLHTSIHFAENLGALIVVSLGGNIETAAATYLTVGLVGTAVRMVWLRAQAGWLVYFSWRVSFGQVRRLMNPALAVLALPVAQALFLQGTVAVVGLAAGSAAVPAFTTVRTLSRIGLQLTMIVNNAVVPEFTMAALDHTRRARLAFMSIASSAVILVPMFLVVVAGGPLVLKLWTHGAIHAPLCPDRPHGLDDGRQRRLDADIQFDLRAQPSFSILVLLPGCRRRIGDAELSAGEMAGLARSGALAAGAGLRDVRPGMDGCHGAESVRPERGLGNRHQRRREAASGILRIRRADGFRQAARARAARARAPRPR